MYCIASYTKVVHKSFTTIHVDLRLPSWIDILSLHMPAQILEVVISDNGPQFASESYAKFAKNFA